MVSATNHALLSLKSEITTSAHISGIESRMENLSKINLLFQSVVNEYHEALRTFKFDAALDNAVGYVHAASNGQTYVVNDTGDASTNSAASELLPQYPDLMFLVDSVDALVRSIAFYKSNAQFSLKNDGRVAGNVSCSKRNIVIAVLAAIAAIIIIAAAASMSGRRTSAAISTSGSGTSSGYRLRKK